MYRLFSYHWPNLDVAAQGNFFLILLSCTIQSVITLIGKQLLGWRTSGAGHRYFDVALDCHDIGELFAIVHDPSWTVCEGEAEQMILKQVRR